MQHPNSGLPIGGPMRERAQMAQAFDATDGAQAPALVGAGYAPSGYAPAGPYRLELVDAPGGAQAPVGTGYVPPVAGAYAPAQPGSHASALDERAAQMGSAKQPQYSPEQIFDAYRVTRESGADDAQTWAAAQQHGVTPKQFALAQRAWQASQTNGQPGDAAPPPNSLEQQRAVLDAPMMARIRAMMSSK